MKRSGLFAIVLTLLFCLASRESRGIGEGFEPIIIMIRGDANNDMVVNFSDTHFITDYLFEGGPAPDCMSAADANDDGSLNITDATYIADWLFKGGPMPPAPGPFDCGRDPTEDLGCDGSACEE